MAQIRLVKLDAAGIREEPPRLSSTGLSSLEAAGYGGSRWAGERSASVPVDRPREREGSLVTDGRAITRSSSSRWRYAHVRCQLAIASVLRRTIARPLLRRLSARTALLLPYLPPEPPA
ncbi:hypothetical protein KM043_001736 [Ampulex compressa]|nr:hypothetical protein KM043_001736 [Ampulex compressa]